MKRSIYLTQIQLSGGNQLFYNAISDRFIVAKCETPTETINKRLIEIGGLIDDEFDEVANYRNKIHSIDNDDSSFFLHVNPTLDCNFRCWYCYEHHINGSVMTGSVLNSTFNLIKRKLSQDNIKTFNLAFFGGEPLLHFMSVARPLIEFCKSIIKEKKIDFTVHFTTNGALINDKILDVLKNVRCTMQITLDGSRESHNQTRFTKLGNGSYDLIIANIIKLVMSDIVVVLRINYTVEILKSAYSMINDLDSIPEPYRHYISIDLQQVWQDRDKNANETVYTDVENLAMKFRQMGFSASGHRPKQGIRQACYGDNSNHILINYNGDIFRCTARNFDSEKRHGVLKSDGTVEWNESILASFHNCKENQTACLECRVGPLCGGVCRQSLMEINDSKNCILDIDEEEKDAMVLNHFEDTYIRN